MEDFLKRYKQRASNRKSGAMSREKIKSGKVYILSNANSKEILGGDKQLTVSYQ